MYNFITDCILGNALMFEIDDYIERWHHGEGAVELHEYLGMSKKEYALFVEDDTYIGLIIAAHKNNTSINSIIRDEMAMAARSDDPNKSKRLQKWLEDEGLWK